MNLEYSWWKIGWQKATVVNCFITQSLLIGQPGKATIDSPTEEVKHCEFIEEECNLKDGASIIWEKNNDISEIFDKRMCKYQKIGHFSGNYSNGIWYSTDMQRSLIFEESAEKIETCGEKLRISNTGFAIREYDFKKIIDQKNKNRVKRYLDRDPSVKLSELLSRLQAEAVFQDKQNRIALENIINILCETIESNQYTSWLSHLEATKFIREKLNNDYLEANWVDKNIIEFWECTPTNYTITPSVDGACFKDIPANISMKNGVIKGFIDPQNLIIKSFSDRGPCDKFRYITTKIDEKVFKIDQWSGDIVEIKPKDIIEEKISNKKIFRVPNLAVHIFVKDSLNNISENQLDMLQLMHSSLGHRGIDNRPIEQQGAWINPPTNNWSISGILIK